MTMNGLTAFIYVILPNSAASEDNADVKLSGWRQTHTICNRNVLQRI